MHSYEVGDGAESRTVHFPRSCLHCETPACVTVCPTGASYKRAEDGIVLVNPDTCIGCKLCSWACPYGAREYDYDDGMMKKCTLCIDRIYNDTFAPEDRIPACVRACPTGARHFGDLGDPDSAVSQLVQEREGFDLLPEIGYQAGQQVSAAAAAPRPSGRARASRHRDAADAHVRLARRSLLRLGRQDPGALTSNRSMHPAYSVIIFTTASGAGYGLLIGLAGAAAFGLVPPDPALGFVGLGLALALITVGLADLDVPSRPAGARLARAVTQWRSSWLSREGIAAIAHLSAGGRARARLGVRRDRARARSPSPPRCRVVVRARHALVHRHDLCLAADHPRLAPAAGGADLSGAGAGNRRRCC